MLRDKKLNLFYKKIQVILHNVDIYDMLTSAVSSAKISQEGYVMKKFFKARKSGFTLVELLIVIMIIAILAGMMLLATGSATDSATATKIINDLRAMKSASLLLYMEENQSWDFAKDGDANFKKSLDMLMDRPLFTDSKQYKDLKIAEGQAIAGDQNNKRDLIGVELESDYATAGVREKLKGNAAKAGLYKAGGELYDGTDQGDPVVYMILH